MSYLVRYKVPSQHLATTVKGETELQGSIHHEALTEFTGLVTRSHGDGTHDIVIFPPAKAPVSIERVGEGDGPGQFSAAEDIEFDAKPKRTKPAAE